MFISQNTTSSTYHQPQYNILNIVCTNPQHSYSVSARLFVSGCQVSVPVKKGVGRPLSARIQLPQFIISHSTASSTLQVPQTQSNVKVNTARLGPNVSL